MSKPKTAILQVADTGPLESLVVMLRSAGYECYLPDGETKAKLRNADCDTVIDIDALVKHMGYEYPVKLPLTSRSGINLDNCDLLVDIKAHRNYTRIVSAYPRLADKVLWYRINGGKPEHVTNQRGDNGDEVNPPCPLLTPNQWYKSSGCEACKFEARDHRTSHWKDPDHPCPICGHFFKWKDLTYSCWPPFYRFNDYFNSLGRPTNGKYTSPACLIHNLNGWGYGQLAEGMQALGVKLYGQGAPDGLVDHKVVPGMLSAATCMVHLKSSDAPGYSLYEALAAGCPVVCTRRLIWKCRMEELLIPGETCLVFDRIGHQGLTDDDVGCCLKEVHDHLEYLSDPANNRRIGMAGMRRLQEIMWNEDRDGPSFRTWMGRMFP